MTERLSTAQSDGQNSQASCWQLRGQELREYQGWGEGPHPLIQGLPEQGPSVFEMIANNEALWLPRVNQKSHSDSKFFEFD